MQKQTNPEEYTSANMLHINLKDKFTDVIKDVEMTSKISLSVLSPILDTISRGHHGGYERGISGEYTRRTTRNVGASSQFGVRDFDVELDRRMAEQKKKIEEDREAKLVEKFLEEQKQEIEACY